MLRFTRASICFFHMSKLTGPAFSGVRQRERLCSLPKCCSQAWDDEQMKRVSIWETLQKRLSFTLMYCSWFGRVHSSQIMEESCRMLIYKQNMEFFARGCYSCNHECAGFFRLRFITSQRERLCVCTRQTHAIGKAGGIWKRNFLFLTKSAFQ